MGVARMARKERGGASTCTPVATDQQCWLSDHGTLEWPCPLHPLSWAELGGVVCTLISYR